MAKLRVLLHIDAPRVAQRNNELLLRERTRAMAEDRDTPSVVRERAELVLNDSQKVTGFEAIRHKRRCGGGERR